MNRSFKHYFFLSKKGWSWKHLAAAFVTSSICNIYVNKLQLFGGCKYIMTDFDLRVTFFFAKTWFEVVLVDIPKYKRSQKSTRVWLVEATLLD